MKRSQTVSGLLLVVLLAAGSVAPGCRKSQGPPPAPPAPVIPISHPVQRTITDFVEYTGRTDAVNSLGVRARVTGYITQLPFKEGAEVKKGDLLYEIDPRPYKAQLDQAEGQLALAKSQLKLAQVTYDRYAAIKGAVSAQELDQYKAQVDQAAAQVEATRASLEVYKLNLEFTKVIAGIDGQVSRRYYTLGNLVNQDQTLLTTIVSVDPIQAYFDMDERTITQIRMAINDGRIKPKDSAAIPVLMGIEGDEGFPRRGTIDFVNNVVNPSTGTIAVRGEFPNPKPEHGRRLLSPGMFVRIRLPIGDPHNALLVVDRALGTDQGLKYAYVVDAEHKVQYRRVKVGALQDDGLRVIEDGLKPDDWVVVGGLQQLRPKSVADTEQVAMPTPGAPTSQAEAEGSVPQPGAKPAGAPTAGPPAKPAQPGTPPTQPGSPPPPPGSAPSAKSAQTGATTK
ncbi:efflux RND transporter periplasmic adaptor subunit [Fimbriiglobus ruber]|uniref:Putative Co/Zn/Cd efflux system membrane fusion protein n=1 Tax=Fimbriiglobus ruber TaxID=1908690 RepID=A0A225D7F3_9BACT|nr:efflux RND transporter periplasmic adaptor subunit [Fimbriiglobus ruber]OWK35574.1 putative Co/Zn/Cd efflux system membrane fusion protein [Fimbriiglobus ruber]